MAAVTAPNPAAAVDPNYAALAARYDSDDDCESDEISHLPSTQPVVQENQHHMTADQQQKQQHTTAAAPAPSDTAGDAAYGANEDCEGFEEEDSEEGDEDDELYAALEWADSREGRWEQWQRLLCWHNCACCDLCKFCLLSAGSTVSGSAYLLWRSAVAIPLQPGSWVHQLGSRGGKASQHLAMQHCLSSCRDMFANV